MNRELESVTLRNGECLDIADHRGGRSGWVGSETEWRYPIRGELK